MTASEKRYDGMSYCLAIGRVRVSATMPSSPINNQKCVTTRQILLSAPFIVSVLGLVVVVQQMNCRMDTATYAPYRHCQDALNRHCQDVTYGIDTAKTHYIDTAKTCHKV